LVSPETFDGPLLNSGFAAINTPACIALLEPCNEQCARDVWTGLSCQLTACSGCQATSVAEAEGCASSAASCACSPYAAKATCSQQLTGANHPASVCTRASFTELYNLMVPLMCGR
jgi:hypothetical protein